VPCTARSLPALLCRCGPPPRRWEPFTDAAIRALSAHRRGLVFLLWGRFAQQKAALVDTTRHHVLTAAHPSGLSARKVRCAADPCRPRSALQASFGVAGLARRRLEGWAWHWGVALLIVLTGIYASRNSWVLTLSVLLPRPNLAIACSKCTAERERVTCVEQW